LDKKRRKMTDKMRFFCVFLGSISIRIGIIFLLKISMFDLILKELKSEYLSCRWLVAEGVE